MNKLLAAAKALLRACQCADADGDLSEKVDGSLMDNLGVAISYAEAEQAAHICTYPADGAPCSICHKPVTVAEPTPTKPDPWACRLHPEGRCGDLKGCKSRYCYDYDTCPFTKTCQKPAPARRTKLDVAVDVWNLLYTPGHDKDWFIKELMKSFGVNPDSEVEG